MLARLAQARLDRAAILLVAVTYGLLVFGASVRVHGAGLACPDWPLCFGEVIPPIDFGVSLEFGHRVLAGLVSLGFLALTSAIGLRYRQTGVGRGALLLCGIAAVVLAVQIVLGGLTVLELLAEWTVASHLLAGNLFCLTLLLVALTLRGERSPARGAVRTSERAFAVLVALLVPVQLALGGLVSSSFAGLACGTWPTCDGVTFVPTLSGPVGLQVIHRLVAYALLGLALAAALTARSEPAKRPARLVAALVLLQAAIGVANVWLRLPVEVTLLHTAGAAAVVLSTTWWNFELFRRELVSIAAPSDVTSQAPSAERA